MNRLYVNAHVGKKNIIFGIGLFLLIGVLVGIPLTIDFFGGSLLTSNQYQTWRVVHGYGVFLSFINYFFGLSIDSLNLTKQQKEISSWSFLLAGVVGGLIRMTLVFLSALGEFGIYASLVETVLFVVGTSVFVLGQMNERPDYTPDKTSPARYSHAK